MTQPVQDVWGALSIPTQPSYAPFVPVAQDLWTAPAEIPLGDPTLAVVLDFLATALNTDQLAAAAWTAVQGNADGKPLKRIFVHDPKEVVFNTTHLPALYMWRENGSFAYGADDWPRDTVKVKGLWIFPLGVQKMQQSREPFVNALLKALEDVIERGRTPGWIQASDTLDPRSQYEGSVFYPYAGFESFFLRSWRRSKFVLKDDVYPAIEIDFDMEEKLDYGLTRFFPSKAPAAATLYDASGTAPWSSFTTYAGGAKVVPTPGNGFIYTASTGGKSGNFQPSFPTSVGDTVDDGTVVWTCSSTMQPNGNVTVSGPLAP